MSNKIREIVGELLDHGVIVFVENGDLKTRSKKGSMTQYLGGLIKSNKDELVRYLTNKDEIDGEITIKSAPKNESGYALSFSQQRLWLLDQIEKGSTQYNIPAALKLSGLLDVDALNKALTTIVERHESLRTVFLDVGQGPRQVIQPASKFNLPMVNLSDHLDGNKTQQIDMVVAEEAKKGFDLSLDLMLRAQLLKLSDNEHVLLVTMHHIASDGWSVGIVIKELSQLYQAYVEGNENPLPALVIQYADYAHWQREWLQGDVLDKHLDYWRSQLSNLPVVHSLPLDKERPQQQTFAGALVSAQLRKSSLDTLNALCLLHGATLFMGLHAAFSVLLARYSGEADIVMGSPIANREQGEVAGLIGFFINTLVLRSDVSGTPSFIDLLQQSKQTALGAYSHQQVPFEQLVEVLQPERSLSHSPLFQIMLVLHNNEQTTLELPGLTLSPVAQTQVQAKFDLMLNAVELESGMAFEWEFNTDLFDRSTIERMAAHFVSLLEDMLSSPNKNVYAIEFLSEGERHQSLVQWNDTQADFPQERCIHEFFEEQVNKNPDAIALAFEERKLSYRELNKQANQLAHYLVTEKNILPDTLVGICLERSFDMVVAILGITKAGGAYVPLDPDYPEARLAYMLEDAGLDTVITNSDVLIRTPITSVQALCLNNMDVQRKISIESIDNLKPKTLDLASNNLAYVIYTSGSTGNPKGVMVGHQAIVNRIHWMHEQYGASAEDVFLQKTPFSFDVSVWEFFWPLMAGAQLVIAKPRGHTDPVYLRALIQEKGVTKLHFVPSMLRAMLSASSLSECRSLQQVFCSGEALAIHHARDFYAALPSSELHNLYGPTEAAVDVSYWACPVQDSPHSSVPIGRPINNVQLHVLDKQLHLLPQGVVGELHIGGVGLARGYLNRSELTAEKFIRNPFSQEVQDRLYKTGDLARWLPDGNLEYVGRIDDQVKIRGFRIELGEIENTLLTHESITETVVVARETGGDKRIVAYVVVDKIESGDASEGELLASEQMAGWRQHLSQRLPEYMLPSSFVVLDALPLTANGKVDRKALPGPDMSQQQNIYVAPSTDTEKVLCEIWQDILNIEQVGVTDNFFRLGGHSLLLIQLLASLQETGRHTDVHSLFRSATLGELAKQLDATEGNIASEFETPDNLIPESSEVITPEMLSLMTLEQTAIDKIVAEVPGGAANIQDVYPLAPLQEGILFHHQMSDGAGDTYVMPVLLATRNSQQRDEFLHALQCVVNRHDVLRSVVLWEGLPQAVQVVCRQVDLSITSLKLNSGAEAMPQLLDLMAPDQQFMDITQAPLLRVKLAEDPETEQYFVLLQLHHIISDHVGLEIIQAEVQAILQGKENTLTSPAPYREFVAHTLHQSQTLNVEKFFKEKLASITEPTAPFNLLDVHGSGGEIVEANQLLPRPLSQQIRVLSRRLAVSPAALFHTVFGLVVGACSGRDDVVFGTVLSGRLQGTAGAGRMLGMFINTLPCRLALKGIGSESMVLQAQAELMELLPYEQASLVLAQQCSGLPSGTPLFSALLNFRHSSPADNDLAENSGMKILYLHERSNYPFTVSVDDLDEDFALTAQVHAAIDPVRVVEYLQTAMAGLVEVLDSAPKKPVLDIDIVSATERHQLLVEWNNTETKYPKELCIHEMFEEQVNKNPDAIALVFEDEKLTYSELNDKANRLARYLVTDNRVQPDTLVGICLERSLEMVIAILGILKAGGAYVPLDAEYPEARLSFMLEDAAVDTVITNREVVARTPITSAQALCWDDADVQDKISEQSSDNLVPQHLGLNSNHLAYVIYTSGSTGNPKGVLVSHQSLQSSTFARTLYYKNKVTSFLLLSSISFDSSVAGIFWTLTSGGKLCIPTEVNPHELERIISDNKVSHLLTLPSLYRELLKSWGRQSLASLTSVIVAGEKCSRDIVDIHMYTNRSCQLFNEYGPTEATVWSSVQLLTKDDVISIGRPIPNIRLYVLDALNNVTPIGVSGELHIAGEGLARGYLNHPELTADKFVANPFSDEANSRLYRTGDLVRWLPDGNLEYIGRIDDQVKIRGFRIELGEIEQSLLAHKVIGDVVVVAREDVQSDTRLVAYVVAEFDIDESDFIDLCRQHLIKKLPEYMVPSAFVVLSSLPLMSNGKVDRKSLPKPNMSLLQNSYEAPSTQTEKVLCEIWQDILGLEQVGVTDNFFKLGGHSLLLIQLLARLQETGRKTDVLSLFSARCLGELAALLDSSETKVSSDYRAPENLIPEYSNTITPNMLSLMSLEQAAIDTIVKAIPGGVANIQDMYPLAPLQEGILFHHQMSEGKGDAYVTSVLLSTESHQQREDFLQALKTVIERHDILRSAVLWKGLPQSVQVVCRQVELPIERLELNSAEEVLPQLVAEVESVLQSMDITQAPLLRVRLAEDPQSGKHFMLLQLHHIISDHVGLEIIQSEVLAILDGKESQLSSPEPYREFVAHTLHQAKTLDAKTFFQDKLASLTEPTAPFNLLDVHGDGGEMIEASQLLPHELSQNIRQLSRRLAVTPAALFHTVFGMVVGACSGRDDVVFGTVLSGRLQGTSGAGQMLGMFINTLPYRLSLQGMGAEASVLLAHTELLDLLPYEQASLALAQQCSGLSGGTPLFSAMLNYRHSGPVYNDVTFDSGITTHAGQERTNYPFSVSVDDLGEEFSLTAQMNAAIDPVRIVGYLQSALEGLVYSLTNSPKKSVLDIGFLSEIERHQLLVEWNDSKSDFPEDCCIHELVEEQVNSNPDAIALVFDEQQLSYRELNNHANQLAHYLITEKNVRPDTLIGICLERSLEIVIAILAITKAGGAYVPLDPDYPEARLAYMLNDASLETVITNSEVLARTPITSVQALCLNETDVQDSLSSQSIDNVAKCSLGLTSRHLAYVIYTSGSTGNPKGVMVGHQAIVNRIHWMHEQYGASSQDVFLQKTPFSFDVSVWEFFWPLMAGARLVIAKPQGHTDPVYLNELIQEKGVTKLHFVPSMLSAMLSGSSLNECRSLKQVFCSGEALAINHVPDFYAALPGRKLHNLYGPTEAAVDVSYWECPEQENSHSSVPIGRPINNIQLRVLDKYLKLVPQGVVGELHIGGIGLARGYLNRAELTAEKFIQNPFSDDSEDRLYKTGDLVRWLSNGNLEYIGRIDDQVKIRGFRIELGEIENALLKHDSVSETVVVARDDTGDKRIVAYVVTNAGAQEDELRAENWRQHLSQTLPDYMLPSSFVVLDILPLTANGKVNRKALPAPDMSQQQNCYVAPVTDTEKVLCEIWQDILGLEQVGVTDNFFRLGGHSLLLIQLLARLQETGRHSDVRSLFSAANLGELAAELDARKENIASIFKAPENLIPESSEAITPEMLSLITLKQDEIDRIAAVVPGGAANVQDMYPLAPLQEGILFHHQMSDGAGDPYVMPVLLTAKTREQRDDFLLALQKVVNRHDVLRTAVLWQGLPQAVQVVCRQVDLSITTIALNPDIEVMPQIEAQMAPAHQFMDITQAPLLRVELAEDSQSGQYFILLKLHHIVDDVSSITMIQTEIQLMLAGKTESLVEPGRYRELVAHALHQAETLNAEVFFRDKLGSISEPTAPFNLLDVHGNGGEIVEVSQRLPTALSQHIRTLSRRLAVSPAALFHSVFGLVVGVCSGRDDVVFGTVLSGRLQGTQGAGQMMGMSINTLPYRLTLRGLGAEELVLKAQAELLALLPYEQSSLSLAQQCSGLPNGTPLFSTMLNYRHTGPVNNDISFDTGIEFQGGHERTNYPFTVSVDDLDNDFEVTAQVSAAIDPVRVVGYLQTAMEGLVEALDFAPQKPVLDIGIISAMERHQLLEGWNDTETNYSKEGCIHELFETQVKNNPDAIALEFKDQKLSYNALNVHANQLAHYLVTEKNVQPDTLVGICLERSLDIVIAILGVLKAGGAYVPLDPNYPEARLTYMLQDAAVDTVITSRDALARTPITAVQALCWDDVDVQKKVSEQSYENIPTHQIGLRSNHLAYAIYTSGSTGNPKGVMIEHRNTNALIHWGERCFASDELSAVLASTSLNFDLSVFEIFLPLAVGGRVILVNDALDLLDESFDKTISLINTVPSVISTLLSHNAIPATVKTINLAGELLKQELVEKLYAHKKDCVVNDLYGPSEDTTYSTYCRRLLGGSPNIGRPIDNGKAYIFSASGTLQPAGVEGELYLGGDGLGRGYLNRPELTSEKFITNPFSDAPDARLYKTGDLVRWLPDGSLEYLGRIDDQVKIRGFRIELGEIENTLLTHDAIKSAVVVAYENLGDKQLVAYVVTSDDRPEDEFFVSTEMEGWRQYLSITLPEYMLPSIFVVLETLPLTPNGKVDRQALPAPDVSQQQSAYVAPSTETEIVLCDIWQDILNLERVGVTDNFFRLGGHSLSVQRMVTQIELQLNIAVPVREVFEQSSVLRLSEFIDGHRQEGFSGLVAIQPREVAESVPLSLVQQSYWFLYQLEASGALYNTPLTFRLSGPLNIPTLERSLHALICRHENLRTRVIDVQSEPRQKIDVLPSWSLPVVYTSVDDVGALVEERSRQAFVLNKEAAFRVTLFCVNSEEHILNIVSHHAVMDGWSMDILLRELSQLYDAFYSGKENPLSPLSIQYGDYAVWQKKVIKGQRYDKQCVYWQAKLSGLAPLLNLPTDYVRPAVQSYRGGRCEMAISPLLSKALSSYAEAQGVTLFHVMISGMAVLLSRYARTTDIPLGTAIANRPQQVLEGLIGSFANTVVLRCDVQNDSGFTSLVHQVKETALDAFANADVPFDGVVEAVQPERSLGVPPIFQVMFRLHNQARGEGVEFNGLALEPFSGEKRQTVELDLNISLAETPSGIQGEFAYATDLFTAETIEHLIQHYIQLLTEAMKSPEKPIYKLGLLSDTEHQQLDRWNDTAVAYPQEECIHTLFEASAARLPSKVAYVCGDREYSYEDLNAKANQIAHWLREQGVGPEVRVGVCVGRSEWMGISLLAVLKSGGTYVPLDPNYPAERLNHMLAAVNPTLILSEQSVVDNFPQTSARIVCFDRDRQLWEDAKQCNPLPILNAEHSAYILFTSGTTGVPKGILVAHKSLRNMPVAQEKWQLLNQEARVLQFASFSFSISIWGSFMAWAAGSTLYQVTDEESLAGTDLYKLLNKENITTLTWPVSLLSVLPVEKMPDSLTTIVSSAEPCNDDVVDRWVKKGCRFLNLYGSSEVSIGSTMYEYKKADYKLTIGAAFPNTQMYLLDEYLQAVPVGAVAEIYTGGVGLAIGYLNQPEETAQKFISNPFSTDESSRLYKTGDLGRYLPNGEIEFIGREDFQVSLRGYRIELTEVEATIRQSGLVEEVAVTVHTDSDNIEHLVCFFVASESDKTPSSDQLSDTVKRTLPSYMVPSVFIVLDAMPLTPNRKLDRLALTVPKKSLLQRESYVAPLTETEKTLCGIWQEMLGLEQVGITDDFFQVGGHSLLALRLIGQVNHVYSRHFPVTALFNSPSVAEFSKIVEASGSVENPDTCLRLMKEGNPDQLPIFIVPGVGGSLLNLFELSDEISAMGSVYGLQAIGLDDGADPLVSVEEIARTNIREIQSVQTEGPYMLMGHSFGGWIVFEMARQLKSLGQDVSIVLLDSPAPTEEVNNHRLAYAQGKNLAEIDSLVDGLMGGESVDKAGLSLIERELKERIQTIARVQASIIYSPEAILTDVEVLYLRAWDQEQRYSESAFQWSSLLSREISYQDVSYDHFGMLERDSAKGILKLMQSHFTALNMLESDAP